MTSCAAPLWFIVHAAPSAQGLQVWTELNWKLCAAAISVKNWKSWFIYFSINDGEHALKNALIYMSKGIFAFLSKFLKILIGAILLPFSGSMLKLKQDREQCRVLKVLSPSRRCIWTLFLHGHWVDRPRLWVTGQSSAFFGRISLHLSVTLPSEVSSYKDELTEPLSIRDTWRE